MKKVMKNKKKRMKTNLVIVVMALLVCLSMPAMSAQAASKTGTYLKKYKVSYAGRYIYVQPAYGVIINRISKKSIRFQVRKNGINGSPLYDTNVIRAKMKKNKASFKWKDSWGNKGKGVLKVYRGYVKIKMTQTYTAKWNRSTLDTFGSFIKLKRKNSNKKLNVYAR